MMCVSLTQADVADATRTRVHGQALLAAADVTPSILSTRRSLSGLCTPTTPTVIVEKMSLVP